MKTKESAFTLPLALAACELWFFPVTRRSAVRLLPLVATLAVIPAAVIDFDKPLDEIATQIEDPIPKATLPRGEYLRTQLPVLTTYLRLLLVPAGQNVDHDYPIYRSLFEPRVLLAMVIIACFGALAWLAWRRSSGGARGDSAARIVSFGIVWFFLTLSVESLVPLPDVIFEHRAYLPSVGFFLAVAVAAAWLARSYAPGGARALTAAAVILPIALAAASFHRNRVWESGVALWSDAVAKAPNKLRPRYNLGEALAKKGDPEGAIRQYEMALRIFPLHPESHNNLGAQYYGRGRVDEAIEHFRIAIAVKPDYAEAHLNLGIAYGDKGWLDRAQEEMSLGMRLEAAAKRGP
jgi:tetratricopeptide (TPR) repeat protein